MIRATHRAFLVVCGVLALSAAIAPAVASADPPQTFQNCTQGVPAPPAHMEFWELAPTPGIEVTDDCPDGLKIEVTGHIGYGQEGGFELAGMRSGFDASEVSFKVTGGEITDGVDFGWAPCGCGELLRLSDLVRDDDRVTIYSPGFRARIFAFCDDPDGCDAGASVTVSDFRFEVQDDSPPWWYGSVAGQSFGDTGAATVWTNDESVPYDVTADDQGFGLTSAMLAIGKGSDLVETLWNYSAACGDVEVFYTTDICPPVAGESGSVPLDALPEGLYEVGAMAGDLADNVGFGGPIGIGVDRTAPAEPGGVTAAGKVNAHGWTNSPALQGSWEPAPEAGLEEAPYSETEYDLRRPGQQPMILGTTQSDVTSSPVLQLPGEGEWELGVRFNDEAGNRGDRAFDPIGYDSDTPVKPELDPIGWVSRDELIAGRDATWTPASQATALESGVCGYGFLVDSDPNTAAPAREDVLPPLKLARLPVRAAGVHHAHVNALSCAGSVSTTDTELIHVDSKAPEFPPEVVPAGWSRSAPSFVLRPSDFDGAGAAGSGVASIHWELSSGDKETVIGDHAEVTPSEADTSITFSATDAVGNTSVPKTVSFTLDTEPPGVWADRDDAANPRAVRVHTTDSRSGVAKVWLERRTAGGSWQLSGGVVDAPSPGAPAWDTTFLIPDADLPAGDYEFRAVALDVAGNRNHDALPLVRMPIRTTVQISAAIADIRGGIVRRGSAAQAVVRPYAAKVALVGQALTGDGDPLADTLLTVSVLEAAATSPYRLTVLTDDTGRFSRTLRSGPTRTFTVRHDGTGTQLPDEATATLNVRPGLTLRASRSVARGGDVTTLSGRLLGSADRVPPGGVRLTLQYLNDGEWDNTGRTARLGEDGRFKIVRRPWPRSGKRGTVWFRVNIESDNPLWPFAPGSSGRVKIRLLP